MQALPVPLTMKVEIRFTRGGSLIENVIHVGVPGGIDAAAISDCGAAVVAAVTTYWLPKIPADTLFTEVVVTNLDIVGGTSRVFPVAANTAGGNGGYYLPNETSIAIRLKAAEGGRGGSGRLFWVGLSDNQTINTNYIKSSSAGEIVAAIQALIDALSAIGQIVVIVSRYLNKTKRATPVTFNDVTPSVYDLVLDSQRRRKPGNGS